jgi:tetratricopeptide (TPR) repeat protein
MSAKPQRTGAQGDDKTYDIAISSAGEDSDYVARLVRALRRRNLKVFFHKEQLAELWGKDERHIRDIFSRRARFVIAVVSRAYANKPWTRFEFQTASVNAEKEGKGEYLLPIRLDDTDFVGLRPDQLHLDARDYSVGKIAGTVADKLQLHPAAEREKVAPPARRPLAGLTRLLASTSRKALGLLAVGELPLPKESLQELFPELEWDQALCDARQMGWVQLEGPFVMPSPQLKRVMQQDASEVEALRRAWLEAIAPHWDHFDIALVAVVQFAALGEIEEAAQLAVIHAVSVREPLWAGLYENILFMLAQSPRFEALPVELRVQLYNARGQCLCNLERFEEARKVFQQLRTFSRAYSDAWGLGQALINEGKVLVHLNDRRARYLYEAAVWHARKTRDKLLLGRALGNLSLLSLERPELASRLLQESRAAKRASRDESGRFASEMTSGFIAAKEGRFREAAQSFRSAERVARRFEQPRDQASALANLGNALLDLERYPTALRTFRQVLDGFERWQVPNDARVTCVRGMALCHWRAGHPGRAAHCFRQLVELQRALDGGSGVLEAEHSLVLALLESGNESEVGAELEQMHRLARKARAFEWLVRCRILMATLSANSRRRLTLFRGAHAAARKIEDRDARIEAMVGLVEACAAHGLPHEAARLLEQVQHLTSDPSLKRVVMQDRMVLLWKAGKEHAARNLFYRLREESDIEGLEESYIDVHMRLGDVLWTQGRSGQEQALQAYIAALIAAISGDGTAFSRVGMHMFRQLFSLPPADRTRRYAWFRTRLVSWLSSQEGASEDSDICHMLLWPLRLAETVELRRLEGKSLTPAALGRLAEKEVERSLAQFKEPDSKPEMASKDSKRIGLVKVSTGSF